MKRFYIIPLLLTFTFSLFSQAPEKVKEPMLVFGDYTEPLIGVTVQNLTSKKGTISDINGQFSIAADETDILRFSYTGYETAEFPVYEIVSGMNKKVVLNSGCMLKEVVITASRPPLITMSRGRGCGGYSFNETDSLQISFDKTWVYYPNPTVEGVTVETSESVGMITTYTLDGRTAGQTTVTGPVTKVDMTDLPAGSYFLFYENAGWSSPVGKVVLQKL